MSIELSRNNWTCVRVVDLYLYLFIYRNDLISAFRLIFRIVRQIAARLSQVIDALSASSLRLCFDLIFPESNRNGISSRAHFPFPRADTIGMRENSSETDHRLMSPLSIGCVAPRCGGGRPMMSSVGALIHPFHRRSIDLLPRKTVSTLRADSSRIETSARLKINQSVKVKWNSKRHKWNSFAPIIIIAVSFLHIFVTYFTRIPRVPHLCVWIWISLFPEPKLNTIYK